MIVSKRQFPSVFQAFYLVYTGANGPSGDFPTEIEVPLIWENSLPALEAGLSVLWHYWPDEFELLCDGEKEEIDAIAAKLPILYLVNEFLEDYFEGWAEHTPKERP
jgi:hypothetical protein